MHLHVRTARRVGKQPQAVDSHPACSALKFDAGPRIFVERPPIALQRRIHGGNLGDFTEKAGQHALDVGLFDAYKRTQRIDVQVAGPKGQAKVTLKRPARKVQLVR